MLISCLCPTYNRFPNHRYLLEEAIESFLKQDYPERELLICNDTPGMVLEMKHPKIRTFNLYRRLPTLSDKLIFLTQQAKGQAMCRWDDDDISLPHRLSYSAMMLNNNPEWRPANYFWTVGQPGVIKEHTQNPGNTHIMSLWKREVLDAIGGYPPGLSGIEDQNFNTRVKKAGLSSRQERIPIKDVFYLYRWGTGSDHLSGAASDDPSNPHQQHYDSIGQRPIYSGSYEVIPYWRQDYIALANDYKTRNA